MIAVRLVPPRRYCSDRTCGGADCTTCYGAHAEVLLDVRVDGRPLADQLVGELLDAPDGAVVAGVAADDVRAALWRATDPASGQMPATTDLLPF
jgi:hypothetical protein